MVFRAEHDTTFGDWHSGPQWKICLAFNPHPARLGDDVLFFFFTSNIAVYRENPVLFADFLEFPRAAYDFIKVPTALDFRRLRTAPFIKLRAHGLGHVGHLSDDDVQRCEHAAGIARVLPPRDKKRLGLR